MDGITSYPPQQTFPADQPLTVTLAAQDWNTVLAAINELPMRIARPVFDQITLQLIRRPGD